MADSPVLKEGPAPLPRAVEQGIPPRPLSPLRGAALPLGIFAAVGASGAGVYAVIAPDASGGRGVAVRALDHAADKARDMLDTLKEKLHLAPSPSRHVAGEMPVTPIPPSTPRGTATIAPVGPPSPPPAATP